MKNLIFRLILMVFVFGISSVSLHAGDVNYEQLIEFKKQNPAGQPRAPSRYPVSFTGTYFMDELIVGSKNYTGEITVQITGISGSLIQAVQISASEYFTIDLSSLPEGVYDIAIITVDKGTFNGVFEK